MRFPCCNNAVPPSLLHDGCAGTCNAECCVAAAQAHCVLGAGGHYGDFRRQRMLWGAEEAIRGAAGAAAAGGVEALY